MVFIFADICFHYPVNYFKNDCLVFANVDGISSNLGIYARNFRHFRFDCISNNFNIFFHLMEKKKTNFFGILGLVVFAIAAMASMSTQEAVDTYKAFDAGWHFGESLRSNVEAEPIAVDSAAIQEMPEVALTEE